MENNNIENYYIGDYYCDYLYNFFKNNIPNIDF